MPSYSPDNHTDNYDTSENAANRPQAQLNPRKICDNFSIRIHCNNQWITGTGYIPTPFGELITRSGNRFKAYGGTIREGRYIRIRGGSSLIYLNNTSFGWADIHGQSKASTWSASLGCLCRE